ncbi:hypothetical protein Tco_0329003 [Tanacetum coccineum]
MSDNNTNLPTQTSSALHNDTVSSCSTSKVQEKTQLSKERCIKSLRAIQSQFKFLTDTLQDFGTMPIFKRTFAQDLDLLEQHLTKEIISQTDCKTILIKLRTMFENAFNSEFKELMQKFTRFDAQSLKDAMICNMIPLGNTCLRQFFINNELHNFDLIVIQNTCSEKEDSNSETASSKLVKESSLDSTTKDVHAIKYKMSKAKERCMSYFRYLHSHLQVVLASNVDSNGHSCHSLVKMLILSQVVNNQFQKFIDSQFTLDYDSQMTDKYFVEYTGIEVKHFKDTLLQHMGNVKKSVAERTRHQRQYDRRVNKRQMQTQESKIDTGKAVDDDLVVTESSGIESEVQDDNNRSGNDTYANDADIRPIYDEEPMAEVDQYPEQCQVKSHMLDSSPDNQTTEYSKQSLESENILLKKTVAQFQKDFSRMEAHCIALELKYQNQALKSGQHGQILNETINKAKIKKEIDVLETMNIELEHSVAKLRMENETLKKHYKDLYDSIKITRSKTIEQTTSLLANNADF